MKAIQKNITISPRKLRLVADSIRHLDPLQAVTYLKFINKSAAKPLLKTIQSALANARLTRGLPPSALRFKTLMIGKGPIYKRWRAVARGSAHPVLKHTSHIYVVLEEKNGAKSQS